MRGCIPCPPRADGPPTPPTLLRIVFLHQQAHPAGLHTAELLSGDVGNRVLDSKTGDQQSGASADADYHHTKALFIAQHVADGHLDQKGQAVPHKGDALEQDAFACLGRFGTHQLRRHTHQLIPAAEVGGTHRAEHRRCQRYQSQPQVEHKADAAHPIHDGIRLPDDVGEQNRAAKKSNQTAQSCCAARVEQVFAHDAALAVAQRLEHTVWVRCSSTMRFMVVTQTSAATRKRRWEKRWRFH